MVVSGVVGFHSGLWIWGRLVNIIMEKPYRHTHTQSQVCGGGGVWLRFAVNASAVSVKRVCSTEILLLNTPLAVLVSVFSLSAALEADRGL